MQKLKYLPEELMEEIIPLTEDYIIKSWKKQADIVVKVKRWSYKLKGLIVTADKFFGLIPLDSITIYPIERDVDKFVDIEIKNLIGRKVVCKIVDVDFSKKGLLLSRAASMNEALKYLQNQTYLPYTYVINTTDETGFLDIGYGIKGKVKYKEFTSSKFYSIADSGCQKGKIFPMQIIGENKEGNIFKLSYRRLFEARDTKIVSQINSGDIIECVIGKKLEDGSGYFVDFLPNASGIVDIKKYDFLLDEDGDIYENDELPELIYGKKAKIFVKKIMVGKKHTNIKGRFLHYS